MRFNKLFIVPAFAAVFTLGACAEEEPYEEPALEEPVVTEPVMTEPMGTEPVLTEPTTEPLEEGATEIGQEIEAAGQEIEQEARKIRY